MRSSSVSIPHPLAIDVGNDLLAVSMLALYVVVLEAWHTEFPIIAFIIALLMSLVDVIPVGMVQAITDQQVGLGVFAEFFAGYWFPGQPLVSILVPRLRVISCQCRSSPSDHDVV